jgi:hypothetical protein
MAYVPVDITINDTTVSKAPISGVVVRVFNQLGTYAFTEGVTDAQGRAPFLLPDGVTYQVRFYKQQVKIKNPLFIEVQPTPETNAFFVSGDIFVPPFPLDARLCTAYGFFRDITGRPQPNVDIHIIAKFKPLLLDGAAITTERVITRTDKNGYAQVDLIRFGEYDVTVQGTDDYQRHISVPDTPNVNIADLFFTVPGMITFSPEVPVTMTTGTELQVVPTVTGTNGVVLPDNGAGDVIWSSSDANILAVLPAGGILTLRALSAGTAEIRAARADLSIIRIPDPGITGVPATVVVTP